MAQFNQAVQCMMGSRDEALLKLRRDKDCLSYLLRAPPRKCVAGPTAVHTSLSETPALYKEQSDRSRVIAVYENAYMAHGLCR